MSSFTKLVSSALILRGAQPTTRTILHNHSTASGRTIVLGGGRPRITLVNETNEGTPRMVVYWKPVKKSTKKHRHNFESNFNKKKLWKKWKILFLFSTLAVKKFHLWSGAENEIVFGKLLLFVARTKNLGKKSEKKVLEGKEGRTSFPGILFLFREFMFSVSGSAKKMESVDFLTYFHRIFFLNLVSIWHWCLSGRPFISKQLQVIVNSTFEVSWIKPQKLFEIRIIWKPSKVPFSLL